MELVVAIFFNCYRKHQITIPKLHFQIGQLMQLNRHLCSAALQTI